MADPMAELEALDTINGERLAAGLAETSSIAEAREWKAGQEKQVKVDEPKPVEDAKPVAAAVDVTAPVAIRAHAQPVTEDTEKASLKAELQRLKSEAGRSTVLANELRDLKARAEDAERRATEAEQKATELADKANEGDLLAGLTQAQREALNDNPEAAAAIASIAKKLMSKGGKSSDSDVSDIRERMAQREAMEAQRDADAAQGRANAMWRDTVAPVVPPEVYSQFPNNPKWEEWGNKRYAGQYNADLFNNAVANAEGETVIEMLHKFMRFAGVEIPTKGQKPPLRAEESRGGTITPATDTDATAKFRYDEINAINQGWLKGRLPTGWSADDYVKWSDRMEKAQSEGRVVDKDGRPVYDLPL